MGTLPENQEDPNVPLKKILLWNAASSWGGMKAGRCPLHTQIFKQANIFNWTGTYRTDSTVVALYERWQYYNENVKTIKQGKNFAANKTKQVALFVSNCGAS